MHNEKKMPFGSQNLERKIYLIQYTYLLVAAASQDAKNPRMNKASPCINAVDGSSGNTSSKTAAVGTSEAELICDRIILPELGKHFARLSPIHPPNTHPNEAPIISTVQRTAVCSWEKPISSNHIGANEKADPGIEPETPCATIIWKDGILITDFAS